MSPNVLWLGEGGGGRGGGTLGVANCEQKLVPLPVCVCIALTAAVS